MPKRRKPPSQSWRVFLANHVNELISIDFFTVPTATFRVLFVLVVLAHHRRRALHFNVTGHPTASVGSAADNRNLSGRYGTHYIIASTPYSMDKAVLWRGERHLSGASARSSQAIRRPLRKG